MKFRDILSAIEREFALKDKPLKAFIGLLIFSLIYILPIILANFYYIDDLGRSLRGYTDWEENGRPLASLLAIALSDGFPLMDVSPWIQILSIVVLDYSLICFVKKYAFQATSFQLFITAAYGYLNLFLLENLSYKYDSLGMILALSLFFLLYAVPEKCPNQIKMILSIITILLSLSLYQAAIGAYISLAIVEFIFLLYQSQTWKEIFGRLLNRIIGLCIGGLLYKFIIVKNFVGSQGYSADHASLANFFTSQGAAVIRTNVTQFGYLFKAFGKTLGILGFILTLAMFIGLGTVAYVIEKRRKESKPIQFLLTLLVIISPAILVISSVLMLILLKNPVLAPRVMLSVSVFTIFVGLSIYHLSKFIRSSIVISYLTLICMLSFSSYYGNLLVRQNQMNTTVTTYLVYDMNQVERESGKEFRDLSFIGHSPQCHELILANQKRPLYGLLVPIYMNNDWFWGGQFIAHFRNRDINLKSNINDKELTLINKPVRENEFYKLYLINNKYIIAFKN